MSLLNTPPVQMNAQVQAIIHSHIMQHLQMKADNLALQQMPQEARMQYEQLNQQAQQVPPAEAGPMIAQANDILAQFSAPILSQLMTEYSQQISVPQDEDPLVSIRKQELALKGQQLAQEQQQFQIDQQRKFEEALRQDKIDRERIATQEDIAEMKDDTARARLDQQRQFQIANLMNKNNR